MISLFLPLGTTWSAAAAGPGEVNFNVLLNLRLVHRKNYILVFAIRSIMRLAWIEWFAMQ